MALFRWRRPEPADLYFERFLPDDWPFFTFVLLASLLLHGFALSSIAILFPQTAGPRLVPPRISLTPLPDPTSRDAFAFELRFQDPSSIARDRAAALDANFEFARRLATPRGLPIQRVPAHQITRGEDPPDAGSLAQRWFAQRERALPPAPPEPLLDPRPAPPASIVLGHDLAARAPSRLPQPDVPRALDAPVAPTVVAIELLPNGRIGAALIEHSCGLAEFDREALRAARLAQLQADPQRAPLWSTFTFLWNPAPSAPAAGSAPSAR